MSFFSHMTQAAPNTGSPNKTTAIIRPLLEGTIKTLGVQSGTTITAEAPFLKGSKNMPHVDLMAVLGLSSNAFNGSIILAFPKATFLGIMGKMLGETLTELSDELSDGASELLNILYGHAKTTLNAQGYEFAKAIPTVVRGAQLVSFNQKDSVHLPVIIPFKCELGMFYLEIFLKPVTP